MKKQFFICLMAVTVLSLTGCGNKQKDDNSYVKPKTGVVSDKLSQEYIVQRIDTIYKLKNDSLCCSQRYLSLDSMANSISERDGTVYLDADHWIVGQDVDPEWRYELVSVNNITDHTANVTLNVHNFTDEEVILDLVFERDDWYVDNFYFYYERSDYDEDGNPIPGTEGIKELNEVKAIQKYIEDSKANEGKYKD